MFCSKYSILYSLEITHFGHGCWTLLQGCTRYCKMTKTVQKQPSMLIISSREETIFSDYHKKTSFNKHSEALSKREIRGNKDNFLHFRLFLDDNSPIRATGGLNGAPSHLASRYPNIVSSNDHAIRLFSQHSLQVCVHAGSNHARDFKQ